MKVRRLDRPSEDYRQCAWPKEKLTEVGWKGYREGRARMSGRNTDTCMRGGAWEVDGKSYCTQHAGIMALQHLEKEST